MSTPGGTPHPLRQPEFVRLLPISLTVALGFGLVVPVLPRFAASFGVGLAVVGLVQFVFGTTRFSFGIVGGLVVDRFGDRACTIAGLVIVALSSYAAGLSQSFLQLVLARGFGGAGSALFMAGLMARILRIIEPAAMGRATGIFRSSFLVGIGLGPALGGLLAQQLGLTAPFHIYATGLLVAAVITYFAMAGSESAAAAERRSPVEALRAARPLFGDVRYVVALLGTFVGWWAISGPVQVIGPVYAERVLDFSDFQIGLAVTMLAVGEIAILLVAGRAADRYGRRAVLVPSLAATAAATLLLGHVAGVPLAYYPLILVAGAGIAASSTATGGLLADAIPRGSSGTAIGVNQMAGDVGYTFSPVIVGLVAEQASFSTAYAVGAVPAALVLLMALRLPGGAGRPAEPEEVPDLHVG